MRKSFFNFALGAITLLGLATSACTTDLCKDVDCGTNGTCDSADGSCICADGYEADANKKCNTAGTAKFVGTWRGAENCGSGPTSPYNITVTAVTGSTNQIRISNFSNTDCTAGVPVEVVGTISKDTNGSYTKVGTFSTDCASGFSVDNSATAITVSGTTMTVAYKVTVSGTTYTCTATMTKQ